MVEGDASVTARPPVPTRNAFSSELFQVWPVVYFVLFVSHLSRVIVHTHSHAREKLCWEYIEHGDANGCCTQAKKPKMGRKRLGVGAAEECVHNRYTDRPTLTARPPSRRRCACACRAASRTRRSSSIAFTRSQALPMQDCAEQLHWLEAVRD